MPRPDHHDRRNGAAINYLSIELDVDAGYNVTAVQSVVLHDRRTDHDLGGDDRLTALERVRAAIDAELGNFRQPDPTRQRNENLDALAAVVDALPATSPLDRNDWLNALYVARHRAD